jgi:hypothetical protein
LQPLVVVAVVAVVAKESKTFTAVLEEAVNLAVLTVQASLALTGLTIPVTVAVAALVAVDIMVV